MNLATMKKIFVITILIGLFQVVHAVEYFTLTKSSPPLTLATNSLVEVVGHSSTYAGDAVLQFTFSNEDTIKEDLTGDFQGTKNLVGKKFIRVKEAKIIISSPNVTAAVTLKVTPAAEIESGGPKTVLVIPEGSTGDYDIVIESSGDMVTWTPMHSQTVTGGGSKSFFRTRIVKR
jgi:hypothetical protein